MRKHGASWRPRGLRSLLSAGIALSTVLGVTGCVVEKPTHEPANKPKMARHADPAGYMLEYPKGWKPAPQGKHVMRGQQFEVLRLRKGATVPDVALDVFVQPSFLLLEDDVDFFLGVSRASDDVSDYELVSRKKRILPDSTLAYVLVDTYSTRTDDGRAKLRQIDLFTITERNDSLDVRLTCLANKYSHYKKQISAIVESVRLKAYSEFGQA